MYASLQINSGNAPYYIPPCKVTMHISVSKALESPIVKKPTNPAFCWPSFPEKPPSSQYLWETIWDTLPCHLMALAWITSPSLETKLSIAGHLSHQIGKASSLFESAVSYTVFCLQFFAPISFTRMCFIEGFQRHSLTSASTWISIHLRQLDCMPTTFWSTPFSLSYTLFFFAYFTILFGIQSSLEFSPLLTCYCLRCMAFCV